MGTAVPIVRADGEGERLSFYGGGLFTMKATTEETGGSFLLFEDQVVRGKTTPLHIHQNEDESLYVLEGAILSQPATPDSDPSGPVDFERVRDAAQRSGGMRVVGPPPFKARNNDG